MHLPWKSGLSVKVRVAWSSECFLSRLFPLFLSLFLCELATRSTVTAIFSGTDPPSHAYHLHCRELTNFSFSFLSQFPTPCTRHIRPDSLDQKLCIHRRSGELFSLVHISILHMDTQISSFVQLFPAPATRLHSSHVLDSYANHPGALAGWLGHHYRCSFPLWPRVDFYSGLRPIRTEIGTFDGLLIPLYPSLPLDQGERGSARNGQREMVLQHRNRECNIHGELKNIYVRNWRQSKRIMESIHQNNVFRKSGRTNRRRRCYF